MANVELQPLQADQIGELQRDGTAIQIVVGEAQSLQTNQAPDLRRDRTRESVIV